jgi:propanol-preferring alcohol dehydrogenase
MRAVQMFGWQTPPELRDVPEPEPGPGEVLLRVTGAGLCHSDLHLLHWPAGTVPYRLPFTLGHEIAGTVAAVADGVDNVEVGESVIVYGPWGCGRCPAAAAVRSTCASGGTSRAAPLRASGVTAAWPSSSWCRIDSPCPSATSTRSPPPR